MLKTLKEEILGFGIFKIYVWKDKVELTISAEEKEGLKAIIYRWNIKKWIEFLIKINRFNEEIKKQAPNQAVIYNFGGERIKIILIFGREREWPKFFELVKKAETTRIGRKR